MRLRVFLLNAKIVSISFWSARKYLAIMIEAKDLQKCGVSSAMSKLPSYFNAIKDGEIAIGISAMSCLLFKEPKSALLILSILLCPLHNIADMLVSCDKSTLECNTTPYYALEWHKHLIKS